MLIWPDFISGSLFDNKGRNTVEWGNTRSERNINKDSQEAKKTVMKKRI